MVLLRRHRRAALRDLRRLILVPSLMVLALTWVSAQPLFDIELLYTDTPSLQGRLPQLVATALRTVADRYLPFYAEIGPAKTSARLSVMLLRESGMAILKATSTGGIEEQAMAGWSSEEELSTLMPPLLFSLWARMQGLAESWRLPAPVASAEISLQALAPLLATPQQVPQTTASLAPAPGGGVFAGGIGYVARLDSELRLKATWLPDSAEPYMYLYQMTTAANGTLFALSSTGQSWWLSRGADGFERGPAIQPLPPSIAASVQSELVYYDYNAGSLIRVSGRRRVPLVLAGTAPLYIMAFTYDTDGNFWLYDQASGLVKSYGPDGSLLQAIRLLAGLDTPQTWQRLHVRGKDIILSGQQGIAAWDQHGLPLWKLTSFSPQADPMVTGTILATTVDSQGALFVLSSGGLSITRYDDERSLALLEPDSAEQLRQLTAANQAVAGDTDNEQAYARRVELLQRIEHAEMELTFRSAMRDAFPGNRSNNQRLTEILRFHSRNRLLAEAEKVYIPLREYGVESARLAFMTAMQNFERYLAQNPQDSEVRQAMVALQDTFRRREAAPLWQPPQPLHLEARLDTIFPAFMGRYRQVPAGTVKVSNPGPQALTKLRLEFFIKDFMDFPAELDFPTPINPGESVELPLFLLFNRGILELSENLVVVATLDALAKTADGEATGRQRLEVDIMARSALTWEDSAALAAFVTPNDDAIVSFTHAAVSAGAPPLFGRPFSRAFAIVTALGARGLAYVEDPKTPFSSVGGSAQVDTVRFPRQTLFNGAGDCDDTTALLASCLEAAGVATAILTTPGHVMLAFAAEGTPQGPGRFQSAVYGALEYAGLYWIPLETTILSKGFAEAWRSGWQEVQRAGAELEIIPLKLARQSYPVLSLPATPAITPLAGEAAYSQLSGLSMEQLSAHWLKPLELAVERAAAGRTKALALNDLAVRQTQFGRSGEAVASLRSALANDSSFRAAQNNLNLLLRSLYPASADPGRLVEATTGSGTGSASLRASQAQLEPALFWGADD